MSDIKFNVSPVYAMNPGVTVTADGAVFSAVFRECTSCGVILYHIPDLEKVTVKFDDSLRYGSLYSVRLSPFDPSEWYYRYFRDNTTFCDPHAREIVAVHTEEDGEISVGKCFIDRDDQISPAGRKSFIPWQDRFIYGLHIKGFTAADQTIDEELRGSFCAAAKKIPYLLDLGVTAVELMPVYELCEDHYGTSVSQKPSSMQEALRQWPVNRLGMPMGSSPKIKKLNFWGFGEGFYFAPKKAYAGTENVQSEFRDMVNAFHDAGIEVYMQLNFTEDVTIHTQLETARFYVTHYHIDGFRLSGNVTSIKSFAADPVLSDTALFYYDFPYAELRKRDPENPESGNVSTKNLAEFKEDFMVLARSLVKSDEYVMPAFARALTNTGKDHGNVHYLGTYNDMTLADTVSYNEKHNEQNGEGGRDGKNNNYSWNCGVEGTTNDSAILKFRRNQIRNLLTVLFVSQGTPYIYEGDERMHTQQGNNNPYCQDNEMTWVNWEESAESTSICNFTKKLAAFRREHPVFRKKTPFRFNDYKSLGYPDLSFHGKEAWMPDISNFSHLLGVMYCENYEEELEETSLLYLAVNMHWEEQSLGLPKLAPNYHWHIIMDTALEDPFAASEILEVGSRYVKIPPRSILILKNTYRKPVPKKSKKPLPSVKAIVRAQKKPSGAGKARKLYRSLSPARRNHLYLVRRAR